MYRNTKTETNIDTNVDMATRNMDIDLKEEKYILVCKQKELGGKGAEKGFEWWLCSVQFSSVQSPSCVQLFATP